MIYIIGLKQDNFAEEGCKEIIVSKIVFKTFNIDFTNYQALLITSKNSLLALQKNNIKIPEHIEIFSIGEATSKYIEKQNYKVFYTGKTAHAKDFQEEILPLIQNKNCLYLRAKEITSNLDEKLKSLNVNLTSLVVYENINLEIAQNPDGSIFNGSFTNKDIFIFLAPSGVKDYFKAFKYIPKNVISIGKTTQNELKRFNIDSICPSKATLQECVNLAKNYFKYSNTSLE